MTRKPKTISKAAPDAVIDGAPDGNQPSVDSVIATEGDPSGENGPDGTNTPASESGDAAGTAAAETVKPQDATTLTPVAPAEATKVATDPEVEASASGTNSTNTPESDQKGEAGNSAGLAGLTAEQVNEIRSRILGIPATERRRFVVVFGPVRYNNVLYPSGARIDLTETEHAELREKRIVASWESGTPFPEVDGQ